MTRGQFGCPLVLFKWVFNVYRHLMYIGMVGTVGALLVLIGGIYADMGSMGGAWHTATLPPHPYDRAIEHFA